MAFSDLREGELKVRRTDKGVLAVLRIQGHEFTAGCGYDEAAELGAAFGLLEADPMAVGGFSFAKLARGIRNVASSIAKSRVIASLAKVAKLLPSPIGDVARMAGQAAKVINGISKGSGQALQAWNAARAIATRNPASPQAVAMRLAMDAVGRPRLGRPPAPAPVGPLPPSTTAPLEPPARPHVPLDGGLRSPPEHELADFAPGDVAGDDELGPEELAE